MWPKALPRLAWTHTRRSFFPAITSPHELLSQNIFGWFSKKTPSTPPHAHHTHTRARTRTHARTYAYTMRTCTKYRLDSVEGTGQWHCPTVVASSPPYDSTPGPSPGASGPRAACSTRPTSSRRMTSGSTCASRPTPCSSGRPPPRPPAKQPPNEGRGTNRFFPPYSFF